MIDTFYALMPIIWTFVGFATIGMIGLFVIGWRSKNLERPIGEIELMVYSFFWWLFLWPDLIYSVSIKWHCAKTRRKLNVKPKA